MADYSKFRSYVRELPAGLTDSVILTLRTILNVFVSIMIAYIYGTNLKYQPLFHIQ